jgi:histidinol phosphatase-like PHP family hydrolase
VTALPLQVDVAAHVHTASNLPERDCQGEQTLAGAMHSAQASGHTGVLFTPHTTNPGVGGPHAFDDSHPMAAALRTYNDDVVRLIENSPRGAPSLFTGLEANILEDGIDTPGEVTRECDFVIASLHGEVPQNAIEVLNRFLSVCHNDEVDGLGHPQRYVEGVPDITWGYLFRVARDTGTAVEVNFNAWHSYGPNKLRRQRDHDGALRAIGYHYEWLRRLGASRAPVLVSLDVHNAGMWPRPAQREAWMPTVAQYAEFLNLVAACGITQERVVNRTVDSFQQWVETPKLDRWRLLPQ